MSAPRSPVLLDSIALVSTLGEHSADTVIVSGSHGGVSAASFVVDHPHRPLIVFFNDAGIGKDDAGIAGLPMLEAIGVAGCAYSHLSARIGEAADGLASGVVSHVNAPARAMGIEAGDRVAAIVAARCGPPGARARPPREPA
ncbi:MAG: hypothetical protein ACO3AD_01460 [Burkholderiaceae bacterium]